MIFLSFSGGLDSTVLLASLLKQNYISHEIQPVFFRYGSKHGHFEEQAACAVWSFYAIRHQNLKPIKFIDLRDIFDHVQLISSLMDSNPNRIPEKSYDEDDSLSSTVVPGRNLIMASILSSMAEADYLSLANTPCRPASIPPNKVAMGMHNGDHALYPDCRPLFISSLHMTLCHGTEQRVSFLTPFANKTKADIVKIGHILGVPFELTRSCYTNQAIPCGLCGTCQERAQAFMSNDLQDPLASYR